METQVDANRVIAALQKQIADMALQIAVRDAQIEQLGQDE